MLQSIDDGRRFFLEEKSQAPAGDDEQSSPKRAPSQRLIEDQVGDDRIIDHGRIAQRRQERSRPVAVGDGEQDLSNSSCHPDPGREPPLFLDRKPWAKSSDFLPARWEL